MTSQYCKLLTIGSYFLSIIIQNIPFGLVRSSSDGIGKIKMERFVLVCDNWLFMLFSYTSALARDKYFLSFLCYRLTKIYVNIGFEPVTVYWRADRPLRHLNVLETNRIRDFFNISLCYANLDAFSLAVLDCVIQAFLSAFWMLTPLKKFNGPTPAHISFILSLSQPQHTLQQIKMWKTIHLVLGAGIQTHGLLHISLLSKPLDPSCWPHLVFVSLFISAAIKSSAALLTILHP